MQPTPPTSRTPDRAAGTPAVAFVPLTRLRAHPDNVRRDLGDLRELVESIRHQGVLQPLRVEHRPGAHMLRIRAGHRRAAAAQLAGLRKVPAVIVPECETDEAITEMFAENLHRQGLSTVEKRDNARRLVEEFGYTPDGIAAATGVHPSTVYAWLRHQPPQQTRPDRRDPRPAARAGQHPRVKPTALHALITHWQHHAADGLGPEQAGAMLAAFADLLGGWTPTNQVAAPVAELRAGRAS